MRPAIISGIVTEDTLVSYWPIFPRPYYQSKKSVQRLSRPSFPEVFEIVNSAQVPSRF